MSNVCFNVVQVFGLTGNGTSMPVENAASVGATEVITSSGSTQTSTLTAPASGDLRFHAWRVANMGTDHIYVAFGTTPDPTATTATAATTAKKGVPAGMVCYFTPSTASEKVAVINA